MPKPGACRRAVVLACVAGVLVSCAPGSGLAARAESERVQASAVLAKPCTPSVCTGERQGAAFEIRLPTRWNGTLLIWSHGYRAAAPVPADPTNPAGPLEQPDRSAEAAPAPEVADDLLAKGYALAGSANSANGWAVTDSVAANKDLYSYFSTTFGKPRRVYLWGASLGGLSTQVLAEQRLPWISGSAPLCAPLAGTNLNLDLALDVAFGVKTLFDPDLRLSGFASHAEAVSAWEHAAARLVAAVRSGRPEAIAGLLALKAISGGPDATMDQDGSTATSTGTAIVQEVLGALGYATFGRYELEQRVGGNPSDNTRADYASRITADVKRLIDAAAPGQLAGVLRTLAAGARVTADAAARTKADALGNPTGRIGAPTLTIHTIDDPLVLSANENVYAKRVDAARSGSELVGFLTEPPAKYTRAAYGAGHCNFTRQEAVAAIDLLDGWVRGGSYPAGGAIAHELDYSIDGSTPNSPASVRDGSATSGYAPSLLPPAWPALEARVVP